VTFNIDAFKVNYHDFQGQQRVGTPPIQYYTTTNAGGLQTKGVEADLSWRVTPRLTLSASGAYIPTKFTEFAVQCYDAYTNPATPVGQCTYLQPGQPATAAKQFNAAGYPLIYSPKYSFILTGDYSMPVGNGLSIDVHGDYNWRSRVYGIVADPNSIVPAYGLFNAQIGFGREDGSWRLSLFARNLFDKYYVAGIFRTPLDAGSYGSTPLSTLGYSNIPAMDSSRNIGVKLNVAFGH
jgi:iron complex outermembrane recepter protein